MAHSVTHTSAKAADIAKLLLLNKNRVTHITASVVWRCSHLTVTPSLTWFGLPPKSNGSSMCYFPNEFKLTNADENITFLVEVITLTGIAVYVTAVCIYIQGATVKMYPNFNEMTYFITHKYSTYIRKVGCIKLTNKFLWNSATLNRNGKTETQSRICAGCQPKMREKECKFAVIVYRPHAPVYMICTIFCTLHYCVYSHWL